MGEQTGEKEGLLFAIQPVVENEIHAVVDHALTLLDGELKTGRNELRPMVEGRITPSRSFSPNSSLAIVSTISAIGSAKKVLSV